MIDNVDYNLFVFGANVPKSEISLCSDITTNNSGKAEAVGLIKYQIAPTVKMYIAKFIMKKCIATVNKSGIVISLRDID